MKRLKLLGVGLPSKIREIAGVVVILLVAFWLGGLFLGDAGPSNDNGSAGDDDQAESTKATVWTCSMHPQIKLPKPGKCPICFMDLIPLTTDSGDDLGPRQLRMSESAKQLARIQSVPAVRRFAEAEIRMVGKVEYDETKLAYITAWVPGRLDRLFADYTGITVKKGDHLVAIYSPELIAAQEELIQAHLAVSRLEQTASRVLLSTAEQMLVAARDKLRLYGLTLEQIDRVEQDHETADHLTIHAPIGGVVVHKDAKEGMYVTTGKRIYTIADLTKLWVVFEAYESDLPWLRYGQRVEFESLSFPGERFEAIISFIDPLVDPRTRTVRVRAVVENKALRLKPDMFVRGVVKSRLDNDANIIDDYLAGKWISPMHPEIVKDAPGQCDVCGMDLVLATSLGYAANVPSLENAPLLIPATAPLVTGTRAVVYVEQQTGDRPVFEGREIELGPRAGEFYVVRSGIEEGELVVSNGAFKIDSELQIQAKPSMMTPAGGGRPPHEHGSSSALRPGQESKDSREPVEAGAEVLSEFALLYDTYFDVQTALAADNLESAKLAAKAMAERVDRIDMDAFSRRGHVQWMEISKPLSESAERLAKAADVEAARDAFYFLSKETIGLHAKFGHKGPSPLFLAHCPMARNGDGADWLQKGSVVSNPYYGESMLRCGSVKELPPAQIAKEEVDQDGL